MLKLSFLVPLYNKEKYIRKCLLSLLNQDLKLDEFEIIVINDGSIDNSAQVVSDLQERHPNIILLNQKNSGTGATRNNALKHAKGKYINFIDADDFVIENSYKPLLNLVEKND